MTGAGTAAPNQSVTLDSTAGGGTVCVVNSYILLLSTRLILMLSAVVHG